MLTLHLASIVLGAGTPLFTGGAPRILVLRSVIATSTTKHLISDVGLRRRRSVEVLVEVGHRTRRTGSHRVDVP